MISGNVLGKKQLWRMEWGTLGGMDGWKKGESLRKLRIIHRSDHELNDEWLDEKIEGVIKDRSGKKRKNKVQYQKTFIISSWIDGCKWWTVKEGKQQCKDKEKRKSRNMRGLWAGGKTRQTVTWTRFESKIKWLKELKKKLETKESNQN